MIRSRFASATPPPVVHAQEIPPELMRSSPREVELAAGGVALVVAAVLLLAAGVGLGAWLTTRAAAEAALHREIEQRGRYVQGEVVDVARRRGKDEHASVAYAYSVDGTHYRGRARVPLRAAAEWSDGSSVSVGYLPARPQTSWLAGYEPRPMPPLLPPLVALGFPAFAAGLSMLLWRQRSLLAEGRGAIARVNATQRVQHQHSHAYRISVDFQDLGGVERSGRFDVNRNPPGPGSTVVIVYDPENPRRIASYPMSLVRVRTN